MKSLSKTIINLDKVLGKYESKKERKVAKIKVKDKVPELKIESKKGEEKESSYKFADYVEKVNGRCALTGKYIGKSIFEFTGYNLIDQFQKNPEQTILLFATDIMVIMILSAIFYKKIDYDNLFEFCEILVYRFAMVQWIYILYGLSI